MHPGLEQEIFEIRKNIIPVVGPLKAAVQWLYQLTISTSNSTRILSPRIIGAARRFDDLRRRFL